MVGKPTIHQRRRPPIYLAIRSFKGRDVEVGQLVEVYRNLHQHGYSIRDAKTKQVLGHAESVHLRDCKLVVSEVGQKRVREKGVRHVHAWVLGILVDADNDVPQGFTRVISYNPYTLNFFTDLRSNQSVTHLPEVVCSDKFLFAP